MCDANICIFNGEKIEMNNKGNKGRIIKGLAGLKSTATTASSDEQKKLFVQGKPLKPSPDLTVRGQQSQFGSNREKMQLENTSATKIQTAFRGHMARKSFPQRKADFEKQLQDLGGGVRFVGMSSENAKNIMKDGFKHRETNNPLEVNDNARNGKGIYLSEDKKIAGNYAEQNSPTGKGAVIRFEKLDLRGLNSIQHPETNPLKTQKFTVGGVSSSVNMKNETVTGPSGREKRLAARKTIVNKKFGENPLDYVTGRTEGMLKQETVLFTQRATQRLNSSKMSILK